MVNKRPQIGIDFDDVLFDFNGAYSSHHNKQYGTNILRDNINIFDMEKVWNLPMSEIIPRIKVFYNSPDHDNAPVIHGAVETLSRLKDKCDIHVITSRPDHMKESTIKWLDKNAPFLKNNIYFTNQFLGDGKMRKKSEVCKELGVEIFVDDAMIHARDIVEAGIPVLLFDTPWNRDSKAENVTRVHSWKDIENIISSKYV